MRLIEDLLADLLDAMPTDAERPGVDLRVVATEVDLVVPIESRIGAGGTLQASLPRGRWSSGFELPLGRLGARFSRGDR